MNLLLDTHAYVWWCSSDSRLSREARSAIANANAIHVSVASAWEIAIKVGTGKWPEAQGVLDRFEEMLTGQSFLLVPITIPDVQRAGALRGELRDPFDRLLSAQALNRDLALVTADRKIASLGPRTIW